MARDHYHPDEPLKRKPTKKQMDLLRRIVGTNGGGISVYRESDSVVSGLIKRHLIQAKSGQSWIMVHTRAGLELARTVAPDGAPCQ